MALTIQDIQLARTRIAPYIVQTPLIRLQNLDAYLGCNVYVKAECMQVTGAYKLRGAMNKILMMTQEELSCGVLAASSGNHGRALAYVAKMLGIKATIVMPDTSPEIKSNAIRTLGAEVVFCETSERFHVAEQLEKETGAVMIPPFNDDDIMAGQGTVGLEILDQCSRLNTVIIPVSGGGLIGGISTAIKSLSPDTKVYGAEPAVLPKYSRSLEAGKPITVPQLKTIADALVAQTPGKACFPYVQANTDGFAAVEDEYILKGMKLLLMEGKLLAEPSSCIGIGAVLQGLISVKAEDEVCFIISGGNVALEQLKILEKVTV